MAGTAAALRRLRAATMKAHWAGRELFHRQTTVTTRWAIVILWAKGRSQRWIGRTLSCSRDTVSRWINAPCHRGRLASAFLTTSRVRVVDWPPLSPDLSPIENVWGEVKRVVDRKRPRDGQAIERTSRAAWKQVTSNRPYVAALYGSMRRRLEAVVQEKGGAIQY